MHALGCAPRMVSTTAWQSSPAVKPGPTPTTTGAMCIVVPRLRFAKMASTTTSGLSSMQRQSGSIRTGMAFFRSRTSFAWTASWTRIAKMPSTLTCPKRTASLNATVRRTVSGCSISVITTEMPLRHRRRAIAVAISPAPRIIASTGTHRS